MTDATRFNGEGLVLSGHYAETMNDVVLPELAAIRRDSTVPGDGDRPLFVSRFDAGRPAGTVMIVHGFTENAEKFSELIYSLLKQGFSVLAYDQRGHGRSWRAEGLAEISVTHVDDFEEYVRDMEKVVEAALADMPRPWLLLAHSMGGAVSSLYMERHPDTFARAALCAPMIAANLGGLPTPAARLMCAGARALGKRKERIFASKPYAGPEDFDTSCATGCERFDWYEALRCARPEFSNNGPTYGWTQEAIRATDLVLAPGEVEKIRTPIQLFSAADDNSVMPEPQKAFAARLPRGERFDVPGSKHEIYRSTDEVLFPWWRQILAFYREAVNGEK